MRLDPKPGSPRRFRTAVALVAAGLVMAACSPRSGTAAAPPAPTAGPATSAALLGSDGLPYVINRFSYAGQVAPQAIIDADDYLSGQFLQGRLPTPESRTDQLPSALAIVDFPA